MSSFQVLLEAEQQASALVNEARQCKLEKTDFVLLKIDFFDLTV